MFVIKLCVFPLLYLDWMVVKVRYVRSAPVTNTLAQVREKSSIFPHTHVMFAPVTNALQTAEPSFRFWPILADFRFYLFLTSGLIDLKILTSGLTYFWLPVWTFSKFWLPVTSGLVKIAFPDFRFGYILTSGFDTWLPVWLGSDFRFV